MKIENVYRPDVTTCPRDATLGAAARAMVGTDAGRDVVTTTLDTLMTGVDGLGTHA